MTCTKQLYYTMVQISSKYPAGVERKEVLLLAMLLVLQLFLYQRILGWEITTAVIPLTATLMISAAFLLIIVSNVSDVGEKFKRDSEEQEASSFLSNIQIRGVFIESIWLVAYITGIYFIGYFTATFIYIFTYLGVKASDPTDLRWHLVNLVYTGGILAFMYWLFLYLLKVGSIWRLGFLP